MKKLKFNKFIIFVSFYLLIGIFSYLLYNSYFDKNIRILTSLNKSKCEEKVSLSNSTLYFNYQKNKYIDSFNIKLPKRKYTKNYNIKNYIDSYLKCNPIPNYLPEELLNKTNKNQTIYYNLNGDLIDDKFILNYKYNTKELSIVTTKFNISKISCINNIKNMKLSYINNTKLKISYCNTKSSFMYFAEFKYKNVYFFIESKNISQKDFTKILLSIIK